MIAFCLPGLRLVSEANSRDDWRVKAHRAKVQRHAVKMHALAKGVRVLGDHARAGSSTLVVTIRRIGPRNLDDDNLARSAKACRDAIAEVLGLDDADPRIVWRYEQSRPDVGAAVKYAVEIEIAEVAMSVRPTREGLRDGEAADPVNTNRASASPIPVPNPQRPNPAPPITSP